MTRKINRISSPSYSGSTLKSLTDTLRLPEDDMDVPENYRDVITKTEPQNSYKLNDVRDGLDSNDDQAASITDPRCQCQPQTSSSGLVDLIRAIDDDERILSLLLRRHSAADGQGGPVCISNTRMKHLRDLLDQLKQFLSKDKHQSEGLNARRLNQRQNGQASSSISRSSIGDISTDKVAAANRRTVGQAAKISRRIWRQGTNHNDQSRNLSLSLGSGLDQGKAPTTVFDSCEPSKNKLADKNGTTRIGTKTMMKFDTDRRSSTTENNKQHAEPKIVAFVNKETLL